MSKKMGKEKGIHRSLQTISR